MNSNINQQFYSDLQEFTYNIQKISRFIKQIQSGYSNQFYEHQIQPSIWTNQENGISNLFTIFHPEISRANNFITINNNEGDLQNTNDYMKITNSHNNLQYQDKKIKEQHERLAGSDQEQDQSKQNISNENQKHFIRGPYNKYTQDIKNLAVQKLKEGIPISVISKSMKIPCKNIKRWQKYGITRKIGAGRKTFDPIMQEKLVRYIEQNYEVGSQINQNEIREKALQFCKDKKFKASKGWLSKFLSRSNLHYEFKLR